MRVDFSSCIRRALLACLVASPLSCAKFGAPLPSSEVASGPTVTAPSGTVEGRREGALRSFKGIPYAAAPVGAARWRPPTNMPRWSGVKQATEYGPACVQPTIPDSSIYSSELGPTSEDCLTLNIWSPADARMRRSLSGSTAAPCRRGRAESRCTTVHGSPHAASSSSPSTIGSASWAFWRFRN